MKTRDYIKLRMRNRCYYLHDHDAQAIHGLKAEINYDHDMLIINVNADMFESKEPNDTYAMRYWNTIFPKPFNVNSLEDIKPAGSDYVKWMDTRCPGGAGATEAEMILYGIAHSCSSFLGIQNPRKSKFAHDSMASTLEAHADPSFKDRPWLLSNLKGLFKHVNDHRLMDRTYGDVCLVARTSSSSIRGHGSFRDYVLEHPLEVIIGNAVNENIPLIIYAGTRSCRRAKYRLIFSFDANFRVIDYLLVNGSYDLCSHRGPLAKFTTEGFNSYQMWIQLALMSDRSQGYSMVCLDYKGYDSQISMIEYLDIVLELNRYRANDPIYSKLLYWYEDWMRQPKPVITRGSDADSILLTNCRTLASGLHGTHSLENIIGISTMLEARRRGIIIPNFWSNGDDQNAKVKTIHLAKYINFIEQHFDVSWGKSLINHRLAIWGKLWFASDIHPFWEIGTLRSIWEKEGGETSFVDSSKFQANYCKIVQTIIIMMRLDIPRHIIESWMCDICSEAEIDPFRIPIELNNLKTTVSSSTRSKDPRGLLSVKAELMSKTYRLKSMNASNYYDMINSMYAKRAFFDQNVDEVEYYPKNQIFTFSRGVDYSRMVPDDVPWVYRNIYSGEHYSIEEKLSRDLLQGTRSFDGPCSLDFTYYDMLSLAESLNSRNKASWNYVRSW
jgi:hypothetical protein